jgi:DNA-binding IclR family transcriptional regulator
MKTIKNALQILALFKDEERPMGVNDVAERLGHGKSYVSRLLGAMRDMDFLQQDPATRKYTVGLEAFALGARYIADTPLTRTALPVMREISNETGDSVFLSIRHGLVCRHILAVEGPYFTETRWRVGVRLPLHASASGKILLAFAPDRDDLLAELRLDRSTPNTIVDRKRFEAELAKTRTQAYSTSREEQVVGLAACAVPLYGEQEALVAALSIVMPEHLLPEKKLKKIIGTLHTGARRLSSLYGARVYPH